MSILFIIFLIILQFSLLLTRLILKVYYKILSRFCKVRTNLCYSYRKVTVLTKYALQYIIKPYRTIYILVSKIYLPKGGVLWQRSCQIARLKQRLCLFQTDGRCWLSVTCWRVQNALENWKNQSVIFLKRCWPQIFAQWKNPDFWQERFIPKCRRGLNTHWPKRVTA